VGNGFGKLTGSTQVSELGEIETPILLTSTLSVPRVACLRECRWITIIGFGNDGSQTETSSLPVAINMCRVRRRPTRGTLRVDVSRIGSLDFAQLAYLS